MDNIRTPQETENQQIPHSGNPDLPDYLREQPVERFDTPLNVAAKRGDLTPLPTQEAKEPNYDKKSKKGLWIGLGATAAGLAIAGGAIFGIKAANEPPQTEPVPVEPGQPNPGGEPVDGGEGTDPGEEVTPENPNANEAWYKEEMSAVDLGPIPAELTSYKEMSLDEFAALSKTEQWKYASWLTKNRAAFMDVFYKYSGNVAANKPTTLTADSPASDILNFYMTSTRQAMAMPVDGVATPDENGPSGKHDLDAAAKISISMHIFRDKADTSTDLISSAVGGEAPSVAMLGLGKAADTSGWEIVEDIAVDDTYENVPAKKHTIRYIDDAGVKHELVTYVYPVTTFDNQQIYVTAVSPNGIVHN